MDRSLIKTIFTEKIEDKESEKLISSALIWTYNQTKSFSELSIWYPFLEGQLYKMR